MKEMEDIYLYVVINEGEPVFVSKDKKEADTYADEQGLQARIRILNEWNNDDPTEDDIAQADWQAGSDGEYYSVEKISLSDLKNNDIIELSDGTEIDSLDVLDLLND